MTTTDEGKRVATSSLLEAWPELAPHVKRAERLVIGLDFDGTLSPIVPFYNDARVPTETRKLVEGLARLHGVEVAIVSGRGIEDLRKRVALSNVTYVGSHGFEMRRSGKVWRHPQADEYAVVMDEILKKLHGELEILEGVRVEPKGYMVTVHYRQVRDAQTTAIVKRQFEKTVSPWKSDGKIRVTTGKKILEIRPALAWGKGHALAVLVAQGEADIEHLIDRDGAFIGDASGILPLYIGDDETDEDAFRAIRRIGITARVGGARVPTAAEYWLAPGAEVREFLKRVKEARSL